jgi:hypothetical protein
MSIPRKIDSVYLTQNAHLKNQHLKRTEMNNMRKKVAMGGLEPPTPAL